MSVKSCNAQGSVIFRTRDTKTHFVTRLLHYDQFDSSRFYNYQETYFSSLTTTEQFTVQFPCFPPWGSNFVLSNISKGF